MPITTDLELRQFLSSKDIPCHDVELLNGGSTNFVWRIKTLLGRRSIVKHAEPYVRAMPSMPLPSEALDHEHKALLEMPGFMSTDEDVKAPRVLKYFPAEHVLLLEDAGVSDLKECYRHDQKLDVPAVAGGLGHWLGKLQIQTSQPKILERLEAEFDGTFASSMFKYLYSGVSSVLRQHGFDPELGERINARFGILHETEKTCLCHGDFWSPNIQLEDRQVEPDVRVKEEGEEAEVKLERPRATVIDWENVHVGNGATDAARFAADAWMLDRFDGSRGMFEAFLRAYLEEVRLDEHARVRFVVHFAVHIIFYSRMRWTDEEGTKELVRVGKEMLEAVEASDMKALGKGPLKILFTR